MKRTIDSGQEVSPPEQMYLSDIQRCVAQGLCTWDQVRQTLLVASLPLDYATRFMDGRIPIPPNAAEMLRTLIQSGEVPLGPVE